MGVAGKAFFLFLILLGIRLWIKKVLDIEKDNKKIETTLEIMNQSYTELQEQIDAARKYRHDIPKHLHIMEEVVLGLSDGKYCDDKLLNAIAHMKVEKCLEKNIDLKITFSMSEKNISTKLPIQEIDFNGLVQNLLDNAIEECCRIPESSERKIIWTIDQISEGIKIWVANSCNNTENTDFNTDAVEKWKKAIDDFVTGKEDKKSHGWGVKIIKETVAATGGRIDYIKAGTNQIHVEVFMPFAKL